MPGHFTHIYTARRVAEHLPTSEVPDWPEAGGVLLPHDPKTCGEIMQR
jgi:hypothetical protein